jgi:protocatechuate 3,4-dioxygenase beta subunit
MAPLRMLVLAALLALTQQPRDGSVEITVKDSLTGRGIPAVQFTLVYFPAEPPNEVTTHFTDGEGHLVIRNLPHGRYVWRMASQRYRPVARQIGTDGTELSFSIDSEQPKYQGEFDLAPIATLSGRVEYPNGEPFPGAKISLMAKAYRNGLAVLEGTPGLRASGNSQTDDRGLFRLTDIPPGDYYIRVENWDAEHLPRHTYYPGVTDSALAVPVAARGNDISVEIQLPRQPVFNISGTVITPMPITVGAFALGSANPGSLEDGPPATFVEASGPNEFRFKIAGVPSGEYFLYPAAVASGSREATITNRTPINVKDTDIENLRIVMKPHVDLKGTVVVDGDSSTIRRESIKVALRTKERFSSTVTIRDMLSTAVSATGDFILANLQPDARFGLWVSGIPADAYVSDIRQGARSIYREGVFVSNPAEGAIEIHVDARGGTVTGSVRDALNQPAKQVSVVVVPEAPRRANSLLYKRTTTDANGAFSIQGVAPGDYHLFAWPSAPPTGAEEDDRFLLPYEGRGVLVRVTPSGKADTQLRLLPQ